MKVSILSLLWTCHFHPIHATFTKETFCAIAVRNYSRTFVQHHTFSTVFDADNRCHLFVTWFNVFSKISNACASNDTSNFHLLVSSQWIKLHESFKHKTTQLTTGVEYRMQYRNAQFIQCGFRWKCTHHSTLCRFFLILHVNEGTCICCLPARHLLQRKTLKFVTVCVRAIVDVKSNSICKVLLECFKMEHFGWKMQSNGVQCNTQPSPQSF